MVIAALKHLVEVHASNALSSLMSVVIIVDIDHQAAQQFPNSVGHLNFELSKLSRFDMGRNVVVREEGHSRLPEAFTYANGDCGAQAC